MHLYRYLCCLSFHTDISETLYKFTLLNGKCHDNDIVHVQFSGSEWVNILVGRNSVSGISKVNIQTYFLLKKNFFQPCSADHGAGDREAGAAFLPGAER